MSDLPITPPRRRITFPDLVRIHFRWRRSLNDDSTASEQEQAALHEEYHDALERFEDEHGELLAAYWCSDVPSAVVLTAGRPDTRWVRRLLSVSPKFHRVSDWATKEEPEIARALRDCEEIAVRAAEVLRGRNRRIAIQLVMTSASYLLSLVDARHTGRREEAAHKAAVAAEQRELAALRAYYRDAANGDAQLVYFVGMVGGITVLIVQYIVSSSVLLAEGVEERTIIGCIVGGALGAIVSVIARINSGTFALDFDVARGHTLFLGSLRPFLGAVFGLLAYFMLTSGFIDVFELPKAGSLDRFYFLCVIAFAAGFSERWAQDTLTGGLGGQGATADESSASAQTAPDRRGSSAVDLEAPKR